MYSGIAEPKHKAIMDLMRLTRASLLLFCDEFDLEVEDASSEAVIRSLLESNRHQEYFEHFGNLILKQQEEKERGSQSKVVSIDLMSFTRASLVLLCDEFDLEVDDGSSEAVILSLLESNRHKEYLEHFASSILIKQEEQEQRERERQEYELAREREQQEYELERERKRQEYEKAMAALSQELERLQQRQQKCQAPVEVEHGSCEEIACTVLPMVGEAELRDPKSTLKGGARSLDRGVAAEEPIEEDRIERDEILCQWDVIEAARSAVDDLAQISSECVAEVALAEDIIEGDEIVCEWDVREAARPAVDDLAQISSEYVAEVALAEGRIERDEVRRQWNYREAAKRAVDDLALLSKEYVAGLTLAEEIRSEPDLSDKGSSVELSQKGALKHNVGKPAQLLIAPR